MQSHQIVYYFFLVTATLFFPTHGGVDVTFYSFYNFSDGIGKRVIGQIQTLKDTLKVNFVDTRPGDGVTVDIEPSVLQILRHKDETPGTIMVFLDGFYFYPKEKLYAQSLKHKIKFAYVTVESTRAPASWVKILNDCFDGILVPDPSCAKALKDSGAQPPIFVLPEILYIDDYLGEPLREKPHYPLCFGVSATALNYKNYDLLLEAFAAEFNNSPDVTLKIHNHRADLASRITNKIKRLGLKNVKATHGPIKNEAYKAHMKSIDCYVLISKGEGFSATPREALALGRPCILANHTAHKTICDTGFVRPVEATIPERHDSENYYGEDVGNVFNCKLADARQALRDVYENYDQYLRKAYEARDWVRKYTGEQLRASFISVLKPKNIILADKNDITNDYLMTDSQQLYEKYKRHVLV